MKNATLTGRMLKALPLILLLLCTYLLSEAQMKIGNHPTQIGRASILELESPNQGLRLTRVPDTSAVNDVFAGMSAAEVDSANGMIVFQTKDSSLYLRSGNYWHKMISADQVNNEYFKLGGNNITTSNAFLGLKGASDSLRIGTDSSSASIIVTPSGVVHILDSLVGVLAKVDSLYSGMASIDTLTVNDSLNVAGALQANSDSIHAFKRFVLEDSLVIHNLKTVANDTALLSISPNGTVHKMSIDSLLKSSEPTIGGITSNTFHLKMGTDSTGHKGPWIDNTSQTNTLIFNIPDASDTIRGLVNTTAQTFAGAKSFQDSVAVGTTISPKSTLDIHGNVGMAIASSSTTGGYDLSTSANDSIRTLIIDVSTISGNLTSPTVVPVKLPTPVKGRIYTIKKIGKANDPQLDAIVEIKPATGSNIEGGAKLDINNNWTSVTLQALNSTDWYIVGH